MSLLILQVLGALLASLAAACVHHFAAEILRTVAYVHDTIGIVPVVAAFTMLLALIAAQTASGRERLAQAWVRAKSWQQ